CRIFCRRRSKPASGSPSHRRQSEKNWIAISTSPGFFTSSRATTSSEDVEESKPAPDVFDVVLKKLKVDGKDAVAIGDTPYDAEAAGKAGVATIGVLCGGFNESD